MIYPNIVSYAMGDVNGDKIEDHIYLTGYLSEDSPFVQNITLVIQDGRNGETFTIPLKHNAGYHPRLFLGDFSGDGIKDIMIAIDSGGSGGIIYYYIYSFANNHGQFLFDFDIYQDQFDYTVVYKDDYKVEVTDKASKKTYIIDISCREADYLNEIYDENGKLKKPMEGFVDPLSGLYPIDYDADNVYELLGMQKISGKYHADSLGYVQNLIKWGYDKFDLESQYVAIWGCEHTIE